ncbi:hypothetical protein JOM56_014659 [Amanita muscaria]
MPTSPVVRASPASHGRFSGLIVDPLEDTTMPSSPVTLPVFTPAKPENSFKTPLSYTCRCLQDVFNKKAPDFHRAQALYQVFIEIASELETTSQFNAVMTRTADNLASLGCKKKPCTLHCDRSHCEPCTLPHAEPCTLPHAEPCTLSHVDPCTLPHFFITPEPCPLPHAEPCTFVHIDPCTLSHADPCNLLHIDPCTLSHAEPCTLPHHEPCALSHAEPCTLNHFPIEPTTVAITIPCPLAHNDLCNKEHILSPTLTSPPPVRQLKRKCFKKKQNKAKAEVFSDNDAYFKGLDSEPEMDLDGFFANPNYNLSDTLEEFKKCGGSAAELQEFHILYEKTHLVDGPCHIPYRLNNSPRIPKVSLPAPQQTDIAPSITPSTQTPLLPSASTSALPCSIPLTSPLTIPPTTSSRSKSVPLAPSNSVKTSLPPCAQTAPPELSRNTLTARRCTNQEASPSSFVKFMDIPVTMTREFIQEWLKENRKCHTVDISNVEIFVMKNKDATIINILKIKFKDDAQSTTAKRVLTTSISFGDTTRRCRPWYLSTRSN